MTEHSPLSCKQLFDFLADYVDATLDPAQRAEFDRHLRACPACGAYLDGYRKTIALSREACCGDQPGEPAKAPPAILDAVRAAMRAQRRE